MRLSKNDYVIETIPPYGADQSFTERILPRAMRRRQDFLDADQLNPFFKFFTVNPVTVPQQISWFAPIGKRLDNLFTGPSSGGMFGHVEIHDSPAIMTENDQSKQDAKCSGGNHEKSMETMFLR